MTRYSTRAFPAYRYVPGRTPHPTRDAAGHSHGIEPDQPRAFGESDWRQCEPYLFGVDLFNHGYWWEAHEAWEGCWKAAGRQTPTGRSLQALIQTAAACLKKFTGQQDGMRRLAANALDNLPRAGSRVLGVPLPLLRADIQARLVDGAAGYPQIRLPDLDSPA